MSRTWSDLRPRVLSAMVMVVVAAGAFWAGPVAFGCLVVVVSGVMVWELAHMLGPRHAALPVWLALLAGGMLSLGPLELVPRGIHANWVLGFGCLVLGGAFACATHHLKLAGGLYACAILVSGAVLYDLYRLQPQGMAPLLLVGVVVVTDIAGYFAGRSIGGRKFWPSISPKKTWAGIVAGWIASAVFISIFVMLDGTSMWFLIPIAVVVSFASQLGDIAESALKRRVNVKDASNLIPGHGGFLDRFDGVVGAGVAFVVASTAVL